MTAVNTPTISVEITDPINARILAVSEDQIQGFHADPIGQIAAKSGVDQPIVIERIRAMLQAGTIRRVRQTLITTSLAEGALVAWIAPEDKLHAVFDWLLANDPFTGHVVLRTSDAPGEAARYRLWTTLKVPPGYSLEKHCQLLCEKTGATTFRLMPARKLFALGVGHMRRRNLEPGCKDPQPAEPKDTHIIELSDLDWQVLIPLKREFQPEEIVPDLWAARAAEAGVDLQTFLRVAQSLDARGVIGRFSTFLEHVKPSAGGKRLTRFNALCQWAVPPGMEVQAGQEIGRFHAMTHAYWRDTGPEFNNVNIMGVAHGTDKARVLAHKAAIDAHLAEVGIPVTYTNIFWGNRSEIRPSEFVPEAYENFCLAMGRNPAEMKKANHR